MDHNKKFTDVDGQNGIKDYKNKTVTEEYDLFEETVTPSSDLIFYGSSIFFQYFSSVVIPAIFLMFGLLFLVLMLYSDAHLIDILLVIIMTIFAGKILTSLELDKNDTDDPE